MNEGLTKFQEIENDYSATNGKKDKTDHQHENRIAMVTQTQNESLYFPLHLPTPPPDASRLPRERHPAEMLLLRIFKSSLEVSSFSVDP